MPSSRKTAATRSGDPRKRAASKRAAAKVQPPPSQATPDPMVDGDDKYTPTAWGSQLGLAEDLMTPSKQLCLVRRPGIQGLVDAGVLHDVDFLTQFVNNKHIRRVSGKPEIDANAVLKNPDALKKATHLIDRVVCHCVLKPHVEMTPNDPTQRVDGHIYADMIDDTDKMFIFNYAVGGTRDAERFLRETRTVMGTLDDGEDVEDSAESTGGDPE